MKLILAYALMIGLTVLANLLLKTGVTNAVPSQSMAVIALNWRVFAGLVSFAAGALLYVFILTKLPLNVAQSFAACQFIAVVIASWLVLGEPIDALRWSGIAMIFLGVLVVGRSMP